MADNVKKVDLEKESVAYFTDSSVPVPGFYTLAGTPEVSEVQTHRSVETVEVQNLHPEGHPQAGKPDGVSYQFVTKDEPAEVIKVKHESNMRPDKRVYPCSDGEGFQYEEPVEAQPAPTSTIPKGVTLVTKHGGDE